MRLSGFLGVLALVGGFESQDELEGRAGEDVRPGTAPEAASETPEWRRALGEQAGRIERLSYDFHVAGGAQLEVYQTEGTYARDASRELEFLELRSVRRTGSDIQRCLREGDEFRHWMSPALDRPGTGRITKAQPSVLRSSYLPKQFGSFLMDRSLADALRTWDWSEQGEELLEDALCLRVVAVPTREADPAGSAASGCYLLWLDLEKDFAPRRVEFLIPEFALADLQGRLEGDVRPHPALELASTKYFTCIRWEAEDLVEVWPGTHMALSGRMSVPLAPEGQDSFAFRIDATSLHVNTDAVPVDFSIAWPAWCRIEDEVRGTGYIHGRPSAESPTEAELLDGLLDYDDVLFSGCQGVRAACSTVATESACGANCLYLVLAEAGLSVSLKDLHREVYVEHSSPASLLALADSLRSRGVQAEVLKVGVDRLGRLPLPLVAHLNEPHQSTPEVGEEHGHFVLIWDVEGDRVLGSDPPRAPRWVDRDLLGAGWTGYVLVLGSRQELAGLFSTTNKHRPELWIALLAVVLALEAARRSRRKAPVETLNQSFSQEGIKPS